MLLGLKQRLFYNFLLLLCGDLFSSIVGDIQIQINNFLYTVCKKVDVKMTFLAYSCKKFHSEYTRNGHFKVLLHVFLTRLDFKNRFLEIKNNYCPNNQCSRKTAIYGYAYSALSNNRACTIIIIFLGFFQKKLLNKKYFLM